MGNPKQDQQQALKDALSLLESLPRNERRSGGLWRQLALMLTGGAILAGGIVAFGIWRTGDQFLTGVRAAFIAPPPPPQVDVRSVIVERVRTVSELTTAVFAMQSVVPASRDRALGGYVIGKTTLLYIAYGEVRAGVDLSNLQPDNVQVAGDTLSLTLPPPQILDSKIDVTRSSVYDYDRGFLGLGPDAAPELQQLAQQKTLETIVKTACEQGLLQEANERARLVLTQLLNTAGYSTVSIKTQTPDTNMCIVSR